MVSRSPGVVNTVQRDKSQEDSNQALSPVLAQSAIDTLNRLLPSMKAKYSKAINFNALVNELELGGIMSKLLNFQPSYKQAAVKQFIDPMKKQSWEHLRFPGITIEDKTPRQWYLQVYKNRRIPDADKQQLYAVIYAAFHLRATRNAIRQHMTDKQKLAHGQAPLSGDYGDVLLYRVLVEELASRLPRNLSFNENRFGKFLLQITHNKLTKSNVPYYINPPDVKPDQSMTFQQLLSTIKGRFILYRFFKDSKEKLEEWATSASIKSLVFTILSAKTQLPQHWELTLRARDITPSELQGLIAKEHQRATNDLKQSR